MPRLTLAVVESFGTPDKAMLVMDDLQKGFGLRITPADTRLFLVKKRIGGKLVKRSFGQIVGSTGSTAPKVPVMTIRDARAEAARLLGRIAGHEDIALPAVQPDEKESFSDLADRWLDQHVRVKLKRFTVRDYERILDATLRPR